MQSDLPGLDTNRYADIVAVGAGASGKVYAAYDKELKKKIAIKSIFLNPSNQRNILKFERETHIMAEVAHPTIVKLISFKRPKIDEPGNAFIFTELMTNGSLEGLLRNVREGKAPPEWNNTTKMEILYGIAVGMNHIHNKGIIHRDLKPGNVLIDDNFHPRITDFGLSKLTENSQSQSTYNGTPKYMAPEILNEYSRYSFPVDVYAYSIIIFEVISGKEAFADRNLYGIMEDAIQNIRPSIPEGFPESYANLMEKCWKQEPDKRPTFAEIVLELLRPEYILEGADMKKFTKYSQFISSPIVSSQKHKTINLNDCDTNSDGADEDDDFIAKLESIKKAAYEGEGEEHIRALVKFGTMLEEGKVIPKDNCEAVRCFKKASDSGNAFAHYKYGSMLEKGLGVEKNLKEACLYYKKAADMNDLDGINAYAFCLLNGIGVEKNAEEGLRLFKASADAKHPTGLYNYGCLYQYGTGVPKNEELAKKYFKEAADLGYVKALVQYGKLLASKQETEEEAVKVFKSASSSGSIDADVQLGIILMKKNPTASAQYFKKAADEGDADGMYRYGIALLYGKGVQMDKSEAAKLFECSSKQGHTNAMTFYAGMLIEGTVIEKNVEYGIELYKKAAARKNKSAAKYLGLLYYEGSVVPQDLQKAGDLLYDQKIYENNISIIHILEKIYANDYEKLAQVSHFGAALKDPESLYLYGLCMVEGKGVKKNAKNGILLIQKAANEKNPNALMALINFYQKNGRKELANKYIELGKQLGIIKVTRKKRFQL